ncbi:MAG: hypothetical protein AB7S38_30270 [Vulcanimicrobiota bacterium]
MKQRGLSLGTVILVVSLLATLGLTLAAASVSHLHLMTRASNARRAESVARSTVAQAVEHILSSVDQRYGTAGESLEVEFASGVGYLSFDPDEARRHGLPRSWNNIESSTSLTTPESVVVPGESIYLVASGTVGGVTRRVEAIYHMGSFPYALAAAGPIVARGGLTVSGLGENDGGGGLPPRIELAPADLHSNAPGAKAIELGADTHIGGDVQAVGDVFLDPAAPADSIEIQGELRHRASVVALPAFEPEHYDPSVLGRSFEPFDDSPYSGELEVEGVARANHGLEVNGGLSLDSALLFVEGDLIVNGPLKGKGILVVTGRTVIRGGADFQTGNKLALMSQGPVEISGSGQAGSFFQGMIHTHSSFQADRITVVGSLIAAGNQADVVSLREVRIIRPEGSGAVEVALGGGTNPAGDVEVSASVAMPGGFSRLLTLRGRVSGQAFRGIWLVDGTPVLDEPLRIDKQLAETLTYFISQIPELRGAIRPRDAADQLANQLINGGPQNTGNPAVVMADPSRLLSPLERMRLLVWRTQ